MCIFRALIYDSIFFSIFKQKILLCFVNIKHQDKKVELKNYFYIIKKKVKKKKVRNSEFMNLDLFKINQRNSFQQFSEKCWFSLKYVIREKTDTCE